MTKIQIYSDVSLSALEDIGSIVFDRISTALNVARFNFLSCKKYFLYKIIDKFDT
ncbi:hypothetical protein CJ739_316 [Mariniflexile rhizosphaerae]|nr:hypothetical protein CJ739_316 [Mariniflexile sp. TRM1-10]